MSEPLSLVQQVWSEEFGCYLHIVDPWVLTTDAESAKVEPTNERNE